MRRRRAGAVATGRLWSAAEVRRATYRAHAAGYLPSRSCSRSTRWRTSRRFRSCRRSPPRWQSRAHRAGRPAGSSRRAAGQGRRWVPDGCSARAVSPGIADAARWRRSRRCFGEYDGRSSPIQRRGLFSNAGKQTRTVSTQRTAICRPVRSPDPAAWAASGRHELGARHAHRPRITTSRGGRSPPGRIMTTTAARAPQTGLRWRFADGRLGTIGTSCPQHCQWWSVCLDRWATDASEIGGVGC